MAHEAMSTSPVVEGEPRAPRSAWRSLLSVVAVVVVLSFVTYFFGDELGALGRGFVDRFGVLGLGAGAFLSDGLHFPLPPQFFLATAIASGEPLLLPVVAIIVGSILGGLVAFSVARALSGGGWSAERFEGVRRVGGLLRRRSFGLVMVALLAPIPYWELCVAAGVYRAPFTTYAIIGACRIPKLLFFFFLIRIAWLPEA